MIKLNRLSSIRINTLLLGVLPAMALGVIFVIYLISSQIDKIEQEFNDHGNAISKEFSRNSAHGLQVNSRSYLTTIIDDLFSHPDILSARIIDSNSQVIVERERPGITDQMQKHGAEARWFKHNVFITPPPDTSHSGSGAGTSSPDNNVAIGQVIIGIEETGLLRQEQAIYRNSLALTLTGLLIAGLISLMISEPINRPIAKLSEAVLKMRKGDYSVQVPEVSRGELGSLEYGFNSLAKEIKFAQENYEEQLDRATSELVQTMEAIEVQNVELDLAKQRAINANKAKSKFLASISHEVRTPLNSMIGFAKLMEQTQLNVEQREYIELIGASANNLKAIITNILDYSELEPGNIKATNSPFNTLQCFEEPIALLAPAAHEKGLELVLICYSDVPKILTGDGGKIRQVVMNLVGNAIKFTDSGEVVLRIMLEEETENDCKIKFSVTDTGPGITPEVMSKLLRSFTQSTAAIEPPHTSSGLGLDICKRIVDSLNGKIEVENQEEGGACFNVMLSLQWPDSTQALDEAHRYTALYRRKLGLFDNNKTSRNAVRHNLLSADMQVTDDSLDHFYTDDLEHLDQVIVGLSSLELDDQRTLDQLTRIIKTLAIPVMLLVSSEAQSTMKLLLASGASSVISKPVRRHHLLMTLMDEAIHKPERTRINSTQVSKIPDLRAFTILVADDNAINLKLIEILVKRTGAKVISVDNGEEALVRFEEVPIDLMIVDIHMPVISGKDVIEKIRGGTLRPEVPIIALTADALPEHRDQVLAIGANAYLTKPFEEQEFWRIVYRELDVTLNIPENIQATNVKYSPLSVRDHEKALKAAAGNQQLADELFRQFMVELQPSINLIITAGENQEWQTLADLAHKLNGAARICGTEQLGSQLTRLETQANNRSADALPEQLALLQKSMQQLLEEAAQ